MEEVEVEAYEASSKEREEEVVAVDIFLEVDMIVEVDLGPHRIHPSTTTMPDLFNQTLTLPISLLRTTYVNFTLEVANVVMETIAATLTASPLP